MSDPTIWAAIISAVGNASAAGLSPTPFQERQSFNNELGTSPVIGMRQTQSTLRDIIGGMSDRAGKDVSLPDAVVGDVPSFSGGGLPMDIGVGATPERLRTPYTLPGVDLGDVRGNIGAGGRITRTPTPIPGGPDDPNGPLPAPKPGGSGEPPPRAGGPPRTGGPPPTRQDPSDPNGSRGPTGGGRTPVLDPTGPNAPYNPQGITATNPFAQQNPQVYGALQLLLHAANPNMGIT